MRRVRSARPSAAMVVALIALSSSLASGATAVTLLTGRDIANRSLTGKDLKASSVTGKHVKNRSLAKKDFRKGHLLLGEAGPVGPQGPAGPQGERGPAGEDGEDGAQGPAGADGEDGTDGAQGPPGEDGQDGAAGATNVVVRKGPDTNMQSTEVITATVSCNDGERAVGGGGSNNGAPGIRLTQSQPTPATTGTVPTGWSVTYENNSGGPGVINAWVICASP